MPLDIDNMSVLDRRRIEAMVLGPMIRAFEQEIGKERAHAVARRVIVKIAEEQGRALSDRMDGDDLPAFSRSKDPLGPRRRPGDGNPRRQRRQSLLQRHPMPLRRNVPRAWHGRPRRHLLLRPRRRPLHRLQPPHKARPHPDHHGRRNPLRLPPTPSKMTTPPRPKENNPCKPV